RAFENLEDRPGQIEALMAIGHNLFGNRPFTDTLYQCLDIARSIHDTSNILEIYYEIQRYQLEIGDYSDVIKIFKEKKKYIRNNRDILKYRLYFDLYKSYNSIGLYDLSINNLNQYLDHCLINKNSYFITHTKIELAKQYLELDRPQEAINILKDIDEDFRKDIFYFKKKYYEGLAQLDFDNLTAVYGIIDELNKGLEWSKKEGDSYYSKSLLIKASIAKNDLYEAKKICLEVLPELKREKRIKRVSEVYAELVKTLVLQKNYDQCLAIEDSIFDYLSKRETQLELEHAHESYWRIHKKLSNDAKALDHLEKKMAIQNYIDSIQIGLVTGESALTAENKILKYKNDLNLREQKSLDEKIKYLTIIAITFILLVILLVYLLTHLKKTKAQELKSNQDEIDHLKEMIRYREKEIKQLNSGSVLNEQSIIERLKKSDDWVELFLNTETAYNIKFHNISSDYENITKTDLKIIALDLFKLSNKEIASILRITENGAKKAKQRVRQKVGLSRDQNLGEYILLNYRA
ncbi:MAG: hypothetical protein MRY83_08315, partial [Flavobacteriales bacterium]|nr:hypothetical protein [Flavobacteriales bacterium]